jgi:hypothetical protein
MTGALSAWLWLEVVRPSWLSLISAPLVLAGYRLVGQKRRAGWLFVMGSQCGLLAIALLNHQYGLLVVVVLIWQAFQNWRSWGQARGAAA